jgi:(S)-mandelate dehydrogenase
MLKAIALGADAVWAGRAPLYGLCAAGAPGVTHALDILKREATDAMGLLGVSSLSELGPAYLCNVRDLGRPRASSDAHDPRIAPG